MRYADGSEAPCKVKGCSLKRAHKKLVNFDSMKDILTNEVVVKVPQLSFDYKYGEGISTREFLKAIQFDFSILKGTYNKDRHQLLPFGYEKGGIGTSQ